MGIITCPLGASLQALMWQPEGDPGVCACARVCTLVHTTHAECSRFRAPMHFKKKPTWTRALSLTGICPDRMGAQDSAQIPILLSPWRAWGHLCLGWGGVWGDVCRYSVPNPAE